jgi:hypothetical protein
MTLYATLNAENRPDVIRNTPFVGAVEGPDDLSLFHRYVDGLWVFTEEDEAEKLAAQPFKSLGRPAFLFMASKIGYDENAILALISAMPNETSEQQDAKLLAELVFKNQQEFRRDNSLLANIVAKTSLTDEQVDVAWRAGESLAW